jgi:protein transport protein SEC20
MIDVPPAENGLAPAPVSYHSPRWSQQPILSDQDQAEVAASTQVTRNLNRLRDGIERALTQSHANNESLEESSRGLSQVGESYDSLDSILASSRELLGNLMRSQKSDTWYLQTTFYMLLTVLAWLVFRRFLYGPLWLLVWLPLKLIFRTTVGVGSAVMKSGGRPSGRGDGIAEQAKVSVDGIPDGSLPTARTGEDKEAPKARGDPDTMLEQVGKMVDEGGEQVAEAPIAAEEAVRDSSGEKDEL